MSLFTRASKIDKKFKICMYGPPGCGKTLAGLTFPEPAVVDMEGGVDWYIGRQVIPGQNTDFELLPTKSAVKVINAINQLEKDIASGKSTIKTLMIDPVTILWSSLQDGYLAHLKKKYGAEAEIKFQHWRSIKGPYNSLMTTLINMPVHLVLIGREGYEYKIEKGELIQVGTKIQTEKDTPYIADIYLRCFSEKDKYFATVEKDRTNLLVKGTVIENFTYQKLYEMAEKAGYFSQEPGERRIQEDENEAAQADGEMFAERDTDDAIKALLEDDAIKKLWTELEWLPGKVIALAIKGNLVTREALGAFLANEVRAKREKGKKGE